MLLVPSLVPPLCFYCPPLCSWSSFMFLCLLYALGACSMLLVPALCSWCPPWSLLYALGTLRYALGTSFIPLVPPLYSWCLHHAFGVTFMFWVPPVCSWYFLGASIKLLVPLLVHGPSLMFLDPLSMFLVFPCVLGPPLKILVSLQF